MRYVLGFLLILMSLACQAAIYMQEDKNGGITYSDTPLNNNATRINLPESGSTTTVPTPTVNTEAPNYLASKTIAKQPYTSFTIVSPKDEETIQNQPVIPVEVKVEPELQKDDQIQLLVDGKLWGNPVASTHLELSLLERGTHQLYAVILDKNQTVLQQSNTITIYVHRNTVVTSPTSQHPPS